MIRLKSLLEQSITTDSDNISDIPKVLFLGDKYTKIKSSYAYRLINSKSVDGRVVAWPNINIKQLVKLAKRYVNNKYQIISILFGDIITNKTDIATFKQSLVELEQITTSQGAKLVIVQQDNVDNQYNDYLDAIDEINSDLSITVSGRLDSTNTQNKLARKWITDVSDSFDINIASNDMSSNNNDNISNDINNTPDSIDNLYKPSKSVYSKTYGFNANYSDSILDQAYDLIMLFEAFTPIAKLDTDGYCRIGHGSSHITKADGTVIDLGKPAAGKTCAETYTYNISEEDAHRDLRRLIKDVFIPGVEKTIDRWGGDISKLNDATVAVLTSVMYNYGHLPNQLKPSISSNDMAAIGNMIKTFPSNARRRAKEGDYILASLDKQDDNIFSMKLGDIFKGKLRKPVPGRRDFGMHLHPISNQMKMHWGIDYPEPADTPIIIGMAGKCILSATSNSAGNWIKIKHDNGAVTTYMHLSKRLVNDGDEVPMGTVIGLVGSTGNSTGPHLHWEYMPAGASDPEDGKSVANEYFAFGSKNEIV